MEALQLLSRDEMKMIIGGYISECTETNCIACDTGNTCEAFDPQKLPEEGCSWGICEECC